MPALTFAVALFVGFAPVAEDKPDEKPEPKLEFRRAERKPAEGLIEAAVAGTTDKVYLHTAAGVTGADVALARVVEGPNRLAVEVVFTAEGAKRMAALSAAHKDKPLAILVDGRVVAVYTVRGAISEKAEIAGSLTKTEAEDLVKALLRK